MPTDNLQQRADENQSLIASLAAPQLLIEPPPVRPKRTPYQTIRDFLEDKRRSDVLDVQADFCHVLARIADELVPFDLDQENPGGIPVPWVTPVLGASMHNSLPPRIEREYFFSSLANQIESTKSMLEIQDDEVVDVARFGWMLIESRDSFNDSLNKPNYPNRLCFEDYQVAILVAVFSVTRAYFFSKLIANAPLNREEDQIVKLTRFDLDLNVGVSRKTVQNVYWERALGSLRKACKCVENRGDYSANSRLGIVNNVMIQMISSIQDLDPHISSGSLLLLSEIAWYYLISALKRASFPITQPSDFQEGGATDPDVYPNWAEQLVAIDMESGDDQDGLEPLAVVYRNALTAIRFELQPATEIRDLRWRDLSKLLDVHAAEVTPPSEPHDRLYWSCVQVLSEQSSRRAECLNSTLSSNHQSRHQKPPSQGHDGSDRSAKIKTASKKVLSKPIVDLADRSTRPPQSTALDIGSLTDQPPPRLPGLPKADMANVPLPVAVSTTFDIELELAMWYFYQKPYMVVLPVSLVFGDDSARKGQQAWIQYVVHPTNSSPPPKSPPSSFAIPSIQAPAEDIWPDTQSLAIRSICAPRPDEFHLIKSDIQHGQGTNAVADSRLRDCAMPIIVKLCGSPLVYLPSNANNSTCDGNPYLPVFDEMNKSGLFPQLSNTNPLRLPKLRHALVLEDFQAMVAAFPEANQSSILALPPDLRISPSSGYWRYWVLLGVDLSDSALRYRLLGQMLGSLFVSQPSNRQTRMGVALNRAGEMTRKARALLRWKEIDMINADPIEFTDQLLHYVEHLRDTNGRHRTTSSGDGIEGSTIPDWTDPVSRTTWFSPKPCMHRFGKGWTNAN